MFWVIFIIVACFAAGAILGAPYLPVRQKDAEAALDLAEVEAGQTVVDLGSGDGRLLIAAAKRGAKAIGYEINPIMYLWSLLACAKYSKQISIRLRNFWGARLPEADVYYVFLIDRYTKKLDSKLQRELTNPTKVVSYVFELPREPKKSTSNTHLYIYP